MTRTLKVLIGAAALAIIGVSTASAQTGPLLGRELYLFDGGSGTTQNTVRLIAPPADTMSVDWTFTLPKNPGGTDFILVNKDGLGKTAWEDGLTIFWGIDGNCAPITPWNGTTGNYIGHCNLDIDFHSGNDHMNFWFNDQTTPRLVLDSNGRMVLNVIDGSEGLIIYGAGPTGPDAGIVLDCANPPTVGLEVNALATGILMPTCAAAPLVGISIKAQTTGIEIDDAPTGLFITDATTGIDAEGAIYFRDIALDATDTRLVSIDDVTGQLSYRTVASTGTIVTTPAGGTLNTLPLWTPSGTELGNSMISQDGAGTLATIGGALSVTGATTMNGTVTVDPTDIALDAADTRILSIDGASGLVGYRTIPANGDIVVSNGPLTNNGAVYTNSTGQLQSVALTDGQLLIGSTGNAPVASTLTQGAGVTITNAAGSITIAVTNPVPAGTATNNTLRWSGTAWVENGNLQSDAFGNTNINGGLTVGDNAADLMTINAGTIDISNVGTSANSTNLLRRNASGDIEVSTAVFPTIPGGSLAINRNVRTDGTGGLTVGAIALDGGANEVTGILPIANGGTNSGTALNNNRIMVSSGGAIVESAAIGDGQFLIGTAGAPAVASITSTGSTVTITSPGNDINLEVANPLPVPAVGNTNYTLRSNGTAWVASGVLLNDGTNVNATGNMDVDGTMTINTVALSATDTRVLTQNGSGLVGYRTIPANGDIPTSNGALANNSAVRTNASGQLETVALANGQILIGAGAAAPTAATLTAGTGISITNGAGSITIATSNEQLPTGTINHSTLRWNGTDWVENTLFRADDLGGLFNNSLSTGANTDNLLTIDAAGNFHETTVATMIGGIPWVIGGNSTAPASGIIGITTASTQDLQFYVNNAQAISIDDATLLTTINNDLTVAENTTLGDNAGDITSIVGNLNVNSSFATAQAVNINTAAAAHTLTLGNSIAGNSITMNSGTITVPNLTAAATSQTLVVLDGSNNLATRTIGNGTNIITGSGTANTITKWTAAGTIGDGSITDDGTTVEFSTAAVEMPNLPNDPSTSTWIVTYNNTTGALEKKDLGAPVQKTKTAQEEITGTGAVRVFTIADAFVTANSVITVTLQDGGANADVNDYSITVLNVAAGQFDVRLSGFIANTETKLVNYTVTNP